MLPVFSLFRGQDCSVRDSDTERTKNFFYFLLIAAQCYHIRYVPGISESSAFNNFQYSSFAERDTWQGFTEVKNNSIAGAVFFKNSFKIRVIQFFKISLNPFVFQRFNEYLIGVTGSADFTFIPGGIQII
jgi:hypothetical protein